MNPPTLHLIGPGKVGLTLATIFWNNGFFTQGDTLGKKSPIERENFSAGDWVLITVPDDLIPKVFKELTSKVDLPLKVWHCSGVLSSKDLPNSHHQLASVHPAKSIAKVMSLEEWRLSPCAFGIEGDPSLLAHLQSVFQPLYPKAWIPLNSEQKVGYHLAQTLACNYLITLQQEGFGQLSDLGLSSTEAKSILEPLLESTLQNLNKVDSPISALTGPVAREDKETLFKHQEFLKTNPKRFVFWKSLVKRTKELLNDYSRSQ